LLVRIFSNKDLVCPLCREKFIIQDANCESDYESEDGSDDDDDDDDDETVDEDEVNNETTEDIMDTEDDEIPVIVYV
jgi:hypothetical protein